MTRPLTEPKTSARAGATTATASSVMRSNRKTNVVMCVRTEESSAMRKEHRAARHHAPQRLDVCEVRRWPVGYPECEDGESGLVAMRATAAKPRRLRGLLKGAPQERRDHSCPGSLTSGHRASKGAHDARDHESYKAMNEQRGRVTAAENRPKTGVSEGRQGLFGEFDCDQRAELHAEDARRDRDGVCGSDRRKSGVSAATIAGGPDEPARYDGNRYQQRSAGQFDAQRLTSMHVSRTRVAEKVQVLEPQLQGVADHHRHQSSAAEECPASQ